MHSDIIKKYLLKAIDAFNRKIVVLSQDSTVLAVNRHVIETQGNDIVGHKCYQALYDRSSPCEECPMEQVLENRKPTLMYRQDVFMEPERSMCLYSYPILSGENVEAVVMLDFGLPVLECVEEKLQRSNAFLRNLILSAVDGVISADKTGKILIFNDAASEISGYTIYEALHSLDIRDVYPGDGAREVMKKLRSAEYGGKGKLKSCQVDVLNRDGESIPINLDAAIIYEGDTEVATIGFFHDLREDIRIRKELEKIQVQLIQAEKMASLGKLAAGVAHQLNNPLGGIILFTKLMMEEYELEAEAMEDLERILKDAQRCRDTVKELLEFARQTSRKVLPHDINQAISRTLFLLENQTLLQNIEVNKQLDTSLPLIPSDIQQLNHVFMNLVLNAAQAMEGKGKLTLKTRLASDKSCVCIEISDTGPGIPEDVLPHIFDPFFTTKEEGKGTGLGLSIVYGIVENHGGKIVARNNSPDKGATFHIRLKIDER
ncbi:ATP-binding protein [Desulfococcaceae bacterium HSG8]|nr:ATP-binding protein [Desulfococcaceae bacterium HSG8]